MNIEDVRVGKKYIVSKQYKGLIGRTFIARKILLGSFILTDLKEDYNFVMPTAYVMPARTGHETFIKGDIVNITCFNIIKVGVCVGKSKLTDNFLCSIDSLPPRSFHKDHLSLVTSKPVSIPKTAAIGIKDRQGFYTNQDLQPPTTIMVAEEELKEFPALALAEYNNFGIRARLV